MHDRVLELRIHGVSNTPPSDLLGVTPKPGVPTSPDDPEVTLVAGDATTGFYRSTDAGAQIPVVEAYSWGQLTSGTRRAVKDLQRALWTLLLPFTLANVALHARPDIPTDPDQETWRSAPGITAWLVRVFCLSLTVTLVLAAVGVGVDLIAWQCVDANCLSQIPGSWEFLGSGWWHTAGRALAIGLLVPFGVLALIGFLAWRSYQYEAELPAPQANDKDKNAPEHPLQQGTFWRGEGQVRRLAVIHLATGASVAAAIPLAALVHMDPPAGIRAVVAGGMLVVLGAVVVLSILVLGHRYVTRREGHTGLGWYGRAVITLAAVGVAAAVSYLLLPDGAFDAVQAELRPPQGCATDKSIAGCDEDRSLPGYDWVVACLGLAQVLLLTAIGGLARSGRRWVLLFPFTAALGLVAFQGWRAGWLGDAPPPLAEWRLWQLAALATAWSALALVMPTSQAVREHGGGGDPHARIAWGGRGPAVFAGFGWVLGLAYAAGVLYWVTDVLNRGATPTGKSPIWLPLPVAWGGLAVIAALLLLLMAAIWAGLAYWRRRRAGLSAVLADYGEQLSEHEKRRARTVASFHGLHRLVGERALRIVGAVALLGLFVAVLGASAALSASRPYCWQDKVCPWWRGKQPDDWEVLVKGLVDIGDRLAGLLPLGIAALGLLVYRSQTVRRAVGVVWDVATFWPRAAHPLAPPCYAERAVPEIQTRTASLLRLDDNDKRRVGHIILSGHSQGAVIGAAVILQMSGEWRQRVWFLSHGCQLTRLYGRAFPAYFGRGPLSTLTNLLKPDPIPSGRAEAALSPARWTNFWRPTDPLGWEVATETGIEVKDPEALRPNGGEVVDPTIRNHSGYPESPEYLAERDRVIRLLRDSDPGQPAADGGAPVTAVGGG